MSDIVERLRDYRGGDVSVWKAMEEAADTITRLTAENEKLRAALVRWLDAVNDKYAFERHQPDNLGKEWERVREAVNLAEDNARAALTVGLAAWPGAHERTDDWCTPPDHNLILPLTQETP